MIIFSDLHLRPESAETAFEVLRAVRDLALQRDKRVVCLGDTWDVRYVLPVAELNAFDAVLRDWTACGIHSSWLIGNHDQINVEGRNAMESLRRPGVDVHSLPLSWGGILWLPYRKHPDDLYAAIREDAGRSRYAFVHHGLIGARMNNGIVAGPLDGLRPDAFSSFTHAFFGHWHRHQTVMNCTYVGSPWQTRADEADEVKGVVELLPETGAWRFIPLRVGKCFHNGWSPTVRPGDVVRLPFAERERARHLPPGVEVRIVGAEEAAFSPPRFAFPPTSSLRDFAVKYVEEKRGDLDPVALMKTFDEVVAG